VAIAGGGPAGAVAALVLARRGVPAVVLEAHAAPPFKVGETLPPNLAPLLDKLGLTASLERDGHLRSQGIRALWGAPEPVENPFLANPYGPGWHVDRRRFEARLAEAAREAGADWRPGVRVERCTAAGQGWQLELSTSREILEADFIADATGRASRLARRLGARRLRYDRLIGVAALLASRTPAADTYTLVEATPEGWWYSALLADGRLAVVAMGDGDLLPRPLLRGDPASWQQLLRRTQATRERVEESGYAVTAPLRILPAESSRLDTICGICGICGDRWIALGDAAAAYDPLSSYGVASAMGSGFYGGHAIADLLAGRPEARLAYLDVMQSAYITYLDLLREHYARERRWPDAPFWRRRRRAYASSPPTGPSPISAS
jgi:flavin-dependent dehydrogenase